MVGGWWRIALVSVIDADPHVKPSNSNNKRIRSLTATSKYDKLC